MAKFDYERAKSLYRALRIALEECKNMSLSPDAASSHVESIISSDIGGFVIYLPRELEKCKTQT